MSWIELKINISQDSLEEVSAYLFAVGCEGINVTDQDIILYFTAHKWNDENKLGLVEYIRNIVPGFSLGDLQIRSIADRDWNDEWKKSFRRIRVTDRIMIIPPWEKTRIREGEIAVIINPKMAFGTGHHESTQLVIIALEKLVKQGMYILDVGTGSGILSFISKKLGAEIVVAIDHDPLAIKNAEENALLNKMAGNIKFFVAQLEQLYRDEFDLICANINRNILMKYSNLFPDFLKQEGILILSGILRQDEPIVMNTFRDNGFKLLFRNSIKEWLCLVLQLKEKKVV